MSEYGSVWDRGPQHPDIWAQPSGSPVAQTDHPDPDSPAGASSPPSEAPASSSPTAAKRSRWSLPRLPTSFWLIVIGVMTLAFWIMCRAHGEDPVFVASMPPVNSTQPTAVSQQSLPVVIPPTPSPSMVDALDARVDATSPPDATAPATASVPAAPVATTAPSTIATTSTVAPPTTTVAPSTTTVVPTTTVAATAPALPPSTTAAPPPSTLEPTGPAVDIVGIEGPCRFGGNCLIAGFTIERFDHQPTHYVREFADGARFTFRFDHDGAMYACATGSPNGSITIEVDGVRSPTFAPHAA